MSQEVPSIDMDALRRRSTNELAKLREALTRIGFIVLMNHRISTYIISVMYELLKLLWALPCEVLTGYEVDGGQRGYTPFGKEHAKDNPRPDLKQFWTVGAGHGATPNIWPAELPDLRPTASSLYARLFHLALEILSAIEQAINYPAGTLTGMISGDLTLLRMINYPPIVGDPLGALRSAPHEDINLITLLVPATEGGLEVKNRDGEWVAVDAIPGSLVINNGDMMQMHSGGLVRSTTHRVVNGEGSGSRDSIPFFVHPAPETVLDRKIGKTAGQFLAERLREIGILKS